MMHVLSLALLVRTTMRRAFAVPGRDASALAYCFAAFDGRAQALSA